MSDRARAVPDGSGSRPGRVSRLAGALLLAVALLGLPAAAEAQARWVAGGGLALSVPRGELDGLIDEGIGVGGQLLYRLDPAGALALRLDGAMVTYGRESFRTPLSRTVSRVLVDVETRNNIALLGFGPQLTLPAGRFRPYVNAAVGLGYFYTESEVKGSRNFRFDDFARTTNFDDLGFSWGGGGGLELGLRAGANPLLLVFDVQYRDQGRTRFLREGSIEETADGRLTFDPLEAEVDLLLLRLGVAVGF